MGKPISRRLLLGLILTGLSVLNLVANGYWLRTGDVHRPNFHSVMRGGWTGFWVTTVLYTVLLLLGVVLVGLEWRRRARQHPHAPRPRTGGAT